MYWWTWEKIWGLNFCQLAGLFFEHTCKKSINLQKQISSCQKIHPQKIVTNYKKSPKNWKPCFCEEKSSSVHTKPQTRPGKLGKNSTFYHNLPQILQNFLRFWWFQKRKYRIHTLHPGVSDKYQVCLGSTTPEWSASKPNNPITWQDMWSRLCCCLLKWNTNV